MSTRSRSSRRTTRLVRHASRHGPRPVSYCAWSISGDCSSVNTAVVGRASSSSMVMPTNSAPGRAATLMSATWRRVSPMGTSATRNCDSAWSASERGCDTGKPSRSGTACPVSSRSVVSGCTRRSHPPYRQPCGPPWSVVACADPGGDLHAVPVAWRRLRGPDCVGGLRERSARRHS